MPRMILLGPPGSGKGTQSRIIRDDFNIPVIATGDILRQNITDNTPLGQAAKSYIDAGDLVPDDLVIDLVDDRLSQDDAQNGWLMDGFPRTVAQADALGKLLADHGDKLDYAILLTVPKELLVSRIAGRRVCAECGAVYHEVTLKPKVTGICDHDGSELITRKDDDPKTMAYRIDVYNEQTAPLVDYYRKKGLLLEIDGTIGIDAIEQKIRAALA